MKNLLQDFNAKQGKDDILKQATENEDLREHYDN
jgi:hypothetical protein